MDKIEEVLDGVFLHLNKLEVRERFVFLSAIVSEGCIQSAEDNGIKPEELLSDFKGLCDRSLKEMQEKD